MFNVGYVLTSTGSGSLPIWQIPAGTGLTFTGISDGLSPYTVLDSDQFIYVLTSGGPVTVLLPDAPTTGRVITVKNYDGAAITNNITITTVGGSVTIDDSTSVTINASYQSMNFAFNGSVYLIY